MNKKIIYNCDISDRKEAIEILKNAIKYIKSLDKPNNKVKIKDYVNNIAIFDLIDIAIGKIHVSSISL